MTLVKLQGVVIRFQICIFDILNTAIYQFLERFVFFQICIFDILNTAQFV